MVDVGERRTGQPSCPAGSIGTGSGSAPTGQWPWSAVAVVPTRCWWRRGVKAMADFAELRVADLMTLDPVAIAEDASIEEAESLLASYRISGLPVVAESGRLVGVISRTDLMGDGSVAMSALLRGNRSGLRVGELMSAPAITVTLDTTLLEAARIMHDAHIHRLVAIDSQDRPIGVLSASDYVALVAEG